MSALRYSMELLDKMEGHKFEYACAELLRLNGWHDVSVTQGSGDYGIDILARRGSVKYAIQCKRYQGNVGVKAVQEAGLGMDFYHCDAAAVITNSSFTNQAVKLANETGVRLLGREFLQELLDNYDEEYDAISPPLTIREKKTVSEKATTEKKEDKRIEKEKGSFTDTEAPKIKEKEKGNKSAPQKEAPKTFLYKNWYYQNGKIYLGPHSGMTPKGAKAFRVFLLISGILIILMGLLMAVFAPPLEALFVGMGIVILMIARKIKCTLLQYEKQIRKNPIR